MLYGNAIKILWLVWLGYWLLSWPGNKKTVQRASPRDRLIALAILIAVGFALYVPDAGWLQKQIIPHNDAVLSLAVALTALGLGFSIWARRTLGRNWSANPTIKEDHELITRGPYRWARHPIYTGLLLALFGCPALTGGKVCDFLFFRRHHAGVVAEIKNRGAVYAQPIPRHLPRLSTPGESPYSVCVLEPLRLRWTPAWRPHQPNLKCPGS